MCKPSELKKTFFSILSETERNISDYVLDPGKDMTRHRKCPLRDTVLLTLSYSMYRTNTEILDYFGTDRPLPSKSAVCQQRSKLSDDLFPHIFHELNRAVPFRKTYKGYHLIAVDGSDINLPTDCSDTVYAVKQARSDRFYYQMHLNASFDLLENRYVDAVIQPRPRMNESDAFCRLVDSCSPGREIFIADRGYVSYNNFAHVIEKGQFFLIRGKTPSSPGSMLRGLPIEEGGDIDVTFLIGRKILRKNAPEHYKYIRPDRRFDPIPPEDRDSVYKMDLRVVCISLPNGNSEYLLTNLPRKNFPAREIGKLYSMRWGIETSFRSLKYALSLVYFHSIRRRLIIQELYARLIMYNFTSVLHRYAGNCLAKSPSGLNCKVSFADAVPIAKKFLAVHMKNGIIKALLLRHLIHTHTQESKPRHVRSQTNRPLNNRA